MKVISRIFQLFLLPLVIAGVFFAWSLPRITTDYNFNTDELIYLSRSTYWDAFKSGDVDNSIWSEWGAYDQPQLTNYIYATVPGDRTLLNATYSPCKPTDTSFHATWSCLAGPPLNTWSDSLTPLKNMVVQARVLATAISALAVASTYCLGLIVGGPMTGVLAALYLGWFSFFRNLGTMVMMDQILLIFLNLQLIITLALMHTKKSTLPLVLLLGAVTGLAMSTKLSAAIPTALLYVALTVTALYRQKYRNVAGIAVSTILAISIFIFLHPPLWQNPVTSITKMITWRTTQIKEQESLEYVPTGLADKITYSLTEGFSSWNSQDTIVQALPVVAIALVALIGLLKYRPTFAWISLVNLIIFVLILPLKWNRYLLPILPSIAVYVGALPLIVRTLSKKIVRHLASLRQFVSGAGAALLILSLALLIPSIHWLAVVIILFTAFLTLQGYLVTRAMLYNFSNRKTASVTPRLPTYSFSLILPARDEAGVLKETIHSLANLNYPKNLYEVLVMIRADDYDTLLAAKSAITQTHNTKIRIIQVDGDAHNKAYSLNIGLHLAKHDVIGIFDAEDEPHQEVLQKVNDYLLQHTDVDAVQAPVHLINVNSSWYASLNAVEYYYWFASVLPYLATKKIVPLGGNTIFTKKETFKRVGTYDETCLTEDADLGIRLAENGVTVGVISDTSLATREETPSTEIGLIRQRSRWDQGYLQVLSKGHWQNLTWTQKGYALYTLTQPLFRHLSFLNMIFAPLLVSLGTVPLWVALVSCVPGYFLFLQLGLYLIGLKELGRLHKIHISPWRYISTVLAFVPYQALLALATFRAVGRLMLGNFTWEKTDHKGSHRPSLAILKG